MSSRSWRSFIVSCLELRHQLPNARFNFSNLTYLIWAKEKPNSITINKRNRIITNPIAVPVVVKYLARKINVLFLTSIYFLPRILGSQIINLISIDTLSSKFFLLGRNKLHYILK